MSFPVRALAPGFAGGAMRKPGEVFQIEADEQLGSWMEPVNQADADRLAPRLAELGKRYPRLPKLDAALPATTAQLRDAPKYKPRTDAPAKPAGGDEL